MKITVLMSVLPMYFQYSQYFFSPSKGGIQLPSNSLLYGHSPIPGTIYIAILYALIMPAQLMLVLLKMVETIATVEN